MKTTRYQFEQTVQNTTANTVEWLKEEFRSILESDKDYTKKADYIGFSVLSIDQRIQSLDEEIKELQQLKKQLKSDV
jgi:peptidoglycan hydrolase CwlO-like protein